MGGAILASHSFCKSKRLGHVLKVREHHSLGMLDPSAKQGLSLAVPMGIRDSQG